jgi:D-alanine-D-alanine ligase
MEVLILRNDRSLLAIKDSEFTEGRIYNYKDVLDVKNALDRMGIKYKEVVIKEDLSNLKEIKKLSPDVVINMCDDFLEPSREAMVPKKLEKMGMAYTGDAYEPLTLCTQKAREKKRLMEFGVTTPKYRLVSSPDDKIKGLKYPLIVKPNSEHGSVGIDADSVVHNEEQLQAKLNEMLAKYGKMLVEEYVDGDREFSTVVIGNRVMRVSEMLFGENEFDGKPKIMTYDAKWKEDTAEYAGTVRKNAKLTKQLEERIKEESIKAYKALGCRSYARVDLRLDKDGTPYVIEVNPNPDISRDGAVAKIAQISKISYLKLIKTMIETAKQAVAEQQQDDVQKIENNITPENQIEEKKAA